MLGDLKVVVVIIICLLSFIILCNINNSRIEAGGIEKGFRIGSEAVKSQAIEKGFAKWVPVSATSNDFVWVTNRIYKVEK